MARRQKLYRVDVYNPDDDLELLLNRLARAGWAYAGVVPSAWDGTSMWYPQLIFKRMPAPEATDA